jgi:hypothetical protein
MVTMQSWKRFKASWIGHGAWMGIAQGNMENGCMGLKHPSWHVTCFKGLGCLGIEMCARSPIETWYVSVGGRFQSSSFEAHVLWRVIFDRPKWMLGCHWNMTCFRVGCSEALAARMWKPTLSRLEVSNAFKTCC